MISVILCTHNDSEMLMPAIRSCFEQDVPIELILVDDASTKPLDPIVSDLVFKEKKITYYKHEVNQGLSAARNTGIKHATYDLVIPLDADDHFFPNVFGKMAAAFEDGVDIVYGNLWTSGTVDYPCAQPFSVDILKRINPIFSSSMYRKEIWERVGGYLVRQGSHYEDWNFWNRCFVAGACFKYVDIVVYKHTERNDSMLRKLEKERAKYIKIATEPLYINEIVRKHKEVKLHLGCGPLRVEEFINIDIDKTPAVDIVDDVKTLGTIPNNSAAVIYACHILEHFAHEEVPVVLKRWYDVLKPGGELRVSVPDIDRIVTIYKDNWKHFQTPGNSPWIGLLYGGQSTPYDFHKTGFNFCWMKYLMEGVGFKEIEEYPHDPHWLSMADSSLARDPFGVYLSLNVKAKK